VDELADLTKLDGFLRPILKRLQAIDGRAPVSLMAGSVDPKDAQLQTWLNEGLSIEVQPSEVHDLPFKKSFRGAQRAFDFGVDGIHKIANNTPICFRMPDSDKFNMPSPRFFAEIF